jgi:hypothetical protein
MQQSARRIIRPDEVKTLDNYAGSEPDRYFYIIYEEHVWECDGYRIRQEGSEDLWTILLVCPICRQNLKIDSTKKKLLIDDKGLHLAEPIACAWPGEFGTACNFRVAIEPPRKREDQMVRVIGPDGLSRQVKIDAVARRV